MLQQPAKQRKQLDAAGAAGDGAQAGGGDVPSRDDPILLAYARRVAGFSGDWPAELSPAKIAYLQYEKPDWADGKIQALAKLIDAACRNRELPIYAYMQESWDGLCFGLVASSCRNTPEMVPVDCGPTKDGSPSHYFSITPDDLAAWWPTLKTSPSELLAAWMQVPFVAPGSDTPKPHRTPKGKWEFGVQRVAWDIAVKIVDSGEKLRTVGLLIAMEKSERLQYHETHFTLVGAKDRDLNDNQLQVKHSTVKSSWITELKKELSQ